MNRLDFAALLKYLSYLEKCRAPLLQEPSSLTWLQKQYLTLFSVRVGNKDKTIIGITIYKHMEHLDIENSVSYMLILQDSKLFVSLFCFN